MEEFLADFNMILKWFSGFCAQKVRAERFRVVIYQNQAQWGELEQYDFLK